MDKATASWQAAATDFFALPVAILRSPTGGLLISGSNPRLVYVCALSPSINWGK